VVPKARPLRSWESFYRNFDPITWLSILLLITLLSVVRYRFKERDLSLAFLVHYQILLEHSNLRNIDIQKDAPRIVGSVALLVFLVLSTSFKTAMISTFTKRPHEHQIASLQDIVESNLKCYTSEHIKSSYEESEEYFRRYVANCTIVKKKKKNWILKEVALKRNAAMTCRGVEYKYALEKLYSMGYVAPLIARVPKKVTIDFVFMYFTKGHPLYHRFVEIANRLFNAGIPQLHIKKAHFAIDKKLKSKELAQSKTLTFRHIAIAVYILLGGLTISSVVFFLEICHFFTF
jgi:ankyrin